MKQEKFPHTRKSLHWWGWRVGGGRLWSHRGEHRNRGAKGKLERFPHRGTMSTSTHQPETLVCSHARANTGSELRLGLQRSDPREGTGVGCVKRAQSAPQLAGRESGETAGPAKEARDHCFRVCEERGFLPRVPTKDRAPPKQAPEKGVNHSYQLRPQRQA